MRNISYGIEPICDAPALLAQVRNAYPPRQGAVPRTNLIFTGILMSLAIAASASPTLARQFSIVTNITVVIFMYVYVAACVALMRLSSAAPKTMRLAARVLAVAALAFCMALIAASEPDLLIWSTAPILVAGVAYVPIRQRRLRAMRILAGI